MHGHHVSAMQPADQRWQGTSLLEHRREQAVRWGKSGAAPSVVPGRDQRQPARGVVSGDRSLR